MSSRHSSTAQEADTSDAINVGSTTQYGSVDPAAARNARTLVGSSSTAEEFRAMNMHISSLAALPSLLAFCSSAIASMPKGVAALPRPRKLAARLSVMGAMASDESA